LKWIEIAFCAVALGLSAAGVKGYGGYAYIVAETAFCIAVSFVFLLLTVLKFGWAFQLEKFFCVFCFALNAAALGIAVYCTVVLFEDGGDRNVTWHGGNDWHHRMAAVSAFVGAAAVLYLYDAI